LVHLEEEGKEDVAASKERELVVAQNRCPTPSRGEKGFSCHGDDLFEQRSRRAETEDENLNQESSMREKNSASINVLSLIQRKARLRSNLGIPTSFANRRTPSIGNNSLWKQILLL
jgi:hypothetical protein